MSTENICTGFFVCKKRNIIMDKIKNATQKAQNYVIKNDIQVDFRWSIKALARSVYSNSLASDHCFPHRASESSPDRPLQECSPRRPTAGMTTGGWVGWASDARAKSRTVYYLSSDSNTRNPPRACHPPSLLDIHSFPPSSLSLLLSPTPALYH